MNLSRVQCSLGGHDMQTIPLGRQDTQLLLADSATTPMHIGGISVFGLPPDTPTDFVVRLVGRLRQQPVNNPPWNYRLARQSFLRSKLAPAWEVVPDEAVGDHLMRHALPAPGGDRELLELVSRLHSRPLDMTRRLWEFHVIEGYANRRFVVYMRFHHALFDATTAMRTAFLLTVENPHAAARAPWTTRRGEREGTTGKTGRAPERKRKREASVLSTLPERIQKRLERYRSLPEFVQAMSRTITAAIDDTSGLVAPYTGPRCMVNGPLTWRRGMAKHAFELAQVRAVAHASEATVNDVVLAISAGALRRYLAEMHALPRQALTAGIPVGLRHGEGEQAGNRVSALFASLATDVRDPFKRLTAIKRSMQAGKKHLLAMSPPSVDFYSTAMIVPALVGSMTGNVMSNVGISNVPGPHTRLFLAGAPLEGCYPLSVLTPFMALNITCISYYEGMYLGLTACPDVVPDVHKLAAYMGDAFDELGAAVKRRAASYSSGAGRSQPLKRHRR